MPAETTPPQLIELRDGARLWTTVTGTGPPVVCCHGGPGLWDYLAPLASLIDDGFTVVRFDQRGCGRSTGDGPFTITQAIDDLDQLRAALGFDTWAIIGHSWGAELAVRYAARHPERTTRVVYIAGVGAGNGFRPGYVAERDRRLGGDLARWKELGERDRTPAEEREWCLLQWRPDFSPRAAARSAEALWATRPPAITVNTMANRLLWADRDTEDLLELAGNVNSPVRMLFGADDPRPCSAADSLFESLPNADRLVFEHAGHAPWAEQPGATRDAIKEFLG
jgi:proline iminopeptidase